MLVGRVTRVIRYSLVLLLLVISRNKCREVGFREKNVVRLGFYFNNTFEPRGFPAHSLDSQLYVGIILCLVVSFFVCTHP